MIQSVSSEEGCSMSDIEAYLKGQLDVDGIKKTIDFLSSEGHIYPTIDDDHFQLCTG